MDILEATLFPFSRIRDEQRGMLEDVLETVGEGGSLLAHAPTGIGKTAASLSPALSYALKNGKTFLFLTPKHSQHRIAIETLKKIMERHGTKIEIVDIVGKQWTCLYEGARDLSSTEFKHFCQSHKRNETCKYCNKVYEKATKNLSNDAKKTIKEIKKRSPLHSEEILAICSKSALCPYEITTTLARTANVIICDYYHIFHPHVRQAFLNKMDKSLEDLVLIVDEAHNLPERIRNLMGSSLSEYSISNAIKEARALREENLEDDLASILKVLNSFGKKLTSQEMFVSKDDLTAKLEDSISMQIQPFIEDLEGFGETVLELPNRYRSYCSSIADFLADWTEKRNEAAYARILNTYASQTGKRYQLSINCLDPAVYSEEIFSAAHASILMSGTLLPLEMYESVLGIRNARKEQYKNPFPLQNRLVLMTSGITTKFTQRSPRMWMRIADTVSRVLKTVPGNIAVFFPSYEMMATVSPMVSLAKKEVLVEKQEMNKSQRHELYKRLGPASEKSGAVLFAVQAGSFSEGMDFPGRLLDCVVVVGLPLERPTLETEALIKYYDFKFNRGWDYGYIYPAMNRALQAAGRCIRSETDRGAIVLMDERFGWQNYKKCFPKDMRVITTEKPEMYLEKFFKV